MNWCRIRLEMASKVPGVSCRLCGEVGHRLSNCWKELGVPPDGFFSGGGAHRDHGDGEEESLYLTVLSSARQPLIAFPLETLTVKTVAHQSAHRMMEFNPYGESRSWGLRIFPTDLPVRW